jgi:hypothetical protein
MRLNSPKTQAHLDTIATLDDQAVRQILVELAGSMFLTLALQILDKRMYPQTDRQGRAEAALERIPNLTESEALGVLVSMAGLTCTGNAMEAVKVS